MEPLPKRENLAGGLNSDLFQIVRYGDIHHIEEPFSTERSVNYLLRLTCYNRIGVGEEYQLRDKMVAWPSPERSTTS